MICEGKAFHFWWWFVMIWSKQPSISIFFTISKHSTLHQAARGWKSSSSGEICDLKTSTVRMKGTGHAFLTLEQRGNRLYHMGVCNQWYQWWENIGWYTYTHTHTHAHTHTYARTHTHIYIYIFILFYIKYETNKENQLWMAKPGETLIRKNGEKLLSLRTTSWWKTGHNGNQL